MRNFLALFRGINVGGRNIVPMKELASLLEDLGLENVRTYIQSGNVVFESGDTADTGLGAALQDAIEERFGFRPELILLTGAEIEQAVADNPYPEADAAPSTVHLTFLSKEPSDPDLDALEAVRAPSERFALEGRVFYLHAPDGIGRSKLATKVERALGVPCTSRNWRTVRKLQEMMRA